MARPVFTRPAWRTLANGALLAIALTLVAELAARALKDWLNPAGPSPVSPVLCAVLLGVAWRNTVGLSDGFVPGLQWITNNLLRLGIALVGLRLSLSGLASTAGMALPVVLACITMALVVSLLVGKALGLSQPLRLLLAAGTAICGCTAICAVTPVVKARAVDTGLALTCVVVLGCTGMLLYPWLAHTVFGNATHAAGVFLGTSIHDTSQVMGAALIYAQQFDASDAVAVAGFTKLLRNLSLLILVPLFAMWSGNRSGSEAKVKRSQVLPAFLIAFVLLALVRTAGDSLTAGTAVTHTWSQAIGVALGASDIFLVCGMTAIGLNVSLADLRGIGARALGAALLVAVAVCTVSLSMTYAIHAFFGA
ncbi:MAG TPA: putative sulfate exporter family transporter [Steroidobacteraceae bacterium]|nr:putative sulfate exporter family transporter [Steroidobacteraceae bacterium]